jgi:NTE family protein
VQPVRALAGRTIDVKSILGGLFSCDTIADRVAKAYRKYLFGSATLQDLPDEPRFVLNATSVQTGALWRFSKPYMGDYQVGLVRHPQVELAVAVGASSAFPPFLSPAILELRGMSFQATGGASLQHEPFTTRVVLSDGGVYDNLGLETVWRRFRTLLVSDAGAKMPTEPRPKADWARHSKRILDLIDNQVRSLRKRQIIGALKSGVRLGAYWGIRTQIQDYHLADPLPCPPDRTRKLAETPTRLAAMDGAIQERLINWGYAVCDAAIRRHMRPTLPRPAQFPYQANPV